MPLTPAERQRKRRQKLKDEGKYEENRNNHRTVAKKSYDKKKEQLKTLSKPRQEALKRQQREATRKRVAKFRARKNEAQIPVLETPTPFRSAVALTRATARARKALTNALPKSPRIRKAVHRILYGKEFDDD